LRAAACSGPPTPESDASTGWLHARSVKTALSRRHSIHSAGVAACFDRASVLGIASQIITSRSASAYGIGRISTASTALNIAATPPMPRARVAMAIAANDRLRRIWRRP
jgi:hypothetical protein